MTEREKARKLRWLPYHKRLIHDRARYILCEKSRRIGFDYCMAYKHTMLRASGQRERDLWCSSADLVTAQEFIEYCRFFLERVSQVAKYFEEQIAFEFEGVEKSVTSFGLKFPNGSRIRALSSNPRALRGKGGDVLISELAFHDDAQVLYAAAQPVIMWGDRLEIGSTHNGEGSFFARCCEDAKLVAKGQTHRGGKKVTPWSYHFVDIHAAVADGLVELINETKGANFTREEFIEDIRAGCATDNDFGQEYCCIASAESTTWLPYDLIYGCENAKCPGMDAPLYEDEQRGMRYAGVDVGRTRDLTVVWIVERIGDVLWTRRVFQMAKTPIPQQVDTINGALRAAKVSRVCVDATGLGIGIADGLKAKSACTVEAITFSGPIKEHMAVPVRQRFEERNVRIPVDDQIREGLHKVKKIVTGANQVRFDAQRDEAGHADEFWALALAIEAAGTAGMCGVSFVA